MSGRWAGGSWLPGAGRDDGKSEAPLEEDGVEGVGGGHPEDCLWGHRQDNLPGETRTGRRNSKYVYSSMMQLKNSQLW